VKNHIDSWKGKCQVLENEKVNLIEKTEDLQDEIEKQSEIIEEQKGIISDLEKEIEQSISGKKCLQKDIVSLREDMRLTIKVSLMLTIGH
jgi:predicted  nucleic acid-binding Zn-ribbon protein